MTDLEIAKIELKTKGLTLIIFKRGKIIFKTKDHKIAGFLSAIDKFGKSLEYSVHPLIISYLYHMRK